MAGGHDQWADEPSRDGSVLIFGRDRRLLYISVAALGVPGLTPDRFR